MHENSSNALSGERLSEITTHWSMVFHAHQGEPSLRAVAREEVFTRYSVSVYRYLFAAVRDPETAQELAHEFALRCLRGDFRRAIPTRGRFRDYVKTVLINLVNDYHRARNSGPRHLSSVHVEPCAAAPSESATQEKTFEQCLCEDLLDRSWRALKDAKPDQYAVLSMKVEQPDMTSREIGEALENQTGTTYRKDSVRKLLERARARFSKLLVKEAAEILDCDSTEELRCELDHLGLLSYCRSAIDSAAR